MRGPSLADFVDLEARLRLDADVPPDELHARDGAIGLRIGARERSDRESVLAWLADLRTDDSPGRRAERRREQIGAALLIGGFVLGALSVAGWLAASARAPLNVVYFWPFFVGVQILLAALFWLTILPVSWLERIPLLGALHEMMRALSAALPGLVARVLERISPGGAESWRDGLAEARRLDWLYGRLRFWLLLNLTQTFAVAFNVGAIAALLVIPTIDDPAFGWRSRLLEETHVVTWVGVVAAPWHWAWPEGAPSEPEIAATRYTSVDERYAAGGDRPPGLERAAAGERPWAAWWPFLLASLFFYGLLPRLFYWVGSRIATRRALASVSFERNELARLCERLRRPRVSTAAEGPEQSGVPVASGPSDAIARTPRLEASVALRWPGVMLDDETLTARLADRFGARPRAIVVVGDVGEADDREALAALETSEAAEAICVVVEAWEPPVGDYMDLLGTLRERAGEGRTIGVVLYNRDAEGTPAPPEERHRVVWEQRLARLGDPWLFVAPLVVSAGEVSR
jgi:hypothetical protein